MADSRVINATVEIEIIDLISEMAQAERRSFSAMVAILLIEATEAREKQSKKLSHAKS